MKNDLLKCESELVTFEKTIINSNDILIHRDIFELSEARWCWECTQFYRCKFAQVMTSLLRVPEDVIL